jgi:tetratricopeptide (TPR) repeat protein
MKFLKRSLKLVLDYINAYNNYANLKIAVDDTEEAIKLYKKAIKRMLKTIMKIH